MLTFLVFAATILVLVGLHEAGHFFVAKAFGVYIKEFAIGFGPKLFSVQGKETKYSLRIIPFGGYVRMAGEDRQETDESIPRDRLLYSKPPYARALISLAGPLANLTLAFLVILVVIWTTAFPVIQVSKIIPETPAAEALQFGDRILRIDGRRVLTIDHITSAIQRSQGAPVAIEIRRDGELRSVSVEPEYLVGESRYIVGAYFYSAAYTSELDSLEPDVPLYTAGLRAGDRIAAINGQAVDTLVGITLALPASATDTQVEISYVRAGETISVQLPAGSRDALELFSGASFAHRGIETQNVGFGAGIALTAGQFVGYVEALADLVRNLISGQTSASEAIQGPVGIAQLLGEGIRIGLGYFFQLLAFLSLNFGLLNLVPFPALDGSRATFALYEWIRGKPIRPEREGIIHAIGFLILIGLMILITYRDIARLFR